MSYQLEELTASRKVSMTPPSVETKWACEGEFDEFQVATIARANIPFGYLHPFAQLYRTNLQVNEVGFKVYHIDVSYGTEKREVGSYRFSFDTLGGTVHINAGVHQQVYPAGKRTYNGLIGVKRDGSVEGCDIVIPALKVVVHFSHPGGWITKDYVATLSRLAGSVSNEAIFNWAPYETLFLGATGSQGAEITTAGTDVTTEIDYHFAISENQTGFAIANITGISKKGWDIAWVSWQQAAEVSLISTQADSVNIVRVYREKALKTLLGFG